ncbi:MAG: DJ-1/PfpI family protein [Hyphomicrobiales bacterium]
MAFPRNIDILMFDDVNMLDVIGPSDAFDLARQKNKRAYIIRYISLDGAPIRASCGLRVAADGVLSSASKAHDLLVPGGDGVDVIRGNQQLHTVLKDWAARTDGSRLISVCSGSLLLAAAGVLDGRTATSHWRRRDEALADFPLVKWNLDALYTHKENIYTSAGVSAGIDLALAIIKEDCGAMNALDVAQEMVVYLKRTGGQSQFSDVLQAQFAMEEPLSLLLEKITNNPSYDWTLERMAEDVNMSSRTLSRKFNKNIGVAPVQFVERIRVKFACTLLSEATSMKRAASLSGFGDLQRMRRAFQRNLGVSVTDYVRGFGS